MDARALHNSFMCGESPKQVIDSSKGAPSTPGSSRLSGAASCPPSAGILYDSPPQSLPFTPLRVRTSG